MFFIYLFFFGGGGLGVHDAYYRLEEGVGLSLSFGISQQAKNPFDAWSRPWRCRRDVKLR